MVRQHLGDEIVPEGKKLDDQTCIVVLMANYIFLRIIRSILHVTMPVRQCELAS